MIVQKKRYDIAITNWMEYLEQEEGKAADSNTIPLITSPGPWKDIDLFRSLRKRFSLTSVPVADAISELKDGRKSMTYNIGDCVVLDTGDVQFARIVAFMESKTNIRSQEYVHTKHFAIVQYLHADLDRPEGKQCTYCKTKEPYQLSRCLEKINECQVCVETKIAEDTQDVPISPAVEKALKEGKVSLDGIRLTKTSKKEEKVNKKPYDHDAKMEKVHERFPNLHRIPFVHYHAAQDYDLQEVTNVITKVLMVEDIRCNVPAYFHIKEPLKNM